jgi:hypothetical protein
MKTIRLNDPTRRNSLRIGLDSQPYCYSPAYNVYLMVSHCPCRLHRLLQSWLLGVEWYTNADYQTPKHFYGPRDWEGRIHFEGDE